MGIGAALYCSATADVYAFGEFLAPIIMGVALWRSRCVPRWLAVLFVVGFELVEQTASVGFATVVLLMAPFAVTMVILAVRIWKTEEPALPSTDNQESNLIAALCVQ